MTPIEIIINAKNNAEKVLKDTATQMKAAGAAATSMAANVAATAAGFAAAQISMVAFSGMLQKAKAAFIDYNASMETTRMAFDNLLKSSAAADFFISKLQKFSRETPFEFPDLQAASKMMLGLGWAARDILPALTAVGNAMAATGTSGAEMTNVIMSISQMKGAGMLDAQNLKELDRRGLAATQILTNHFKMSVEQIQKSGKDIDEIIGVLIKGMNEKFAGAMDKQKGTWNQLTSNLGDEWGQIAGELGTPVFNMFKDTLVEAEKWSGSFLEIMQEQGLKQAIETMVPKNIEDVFKDLYDGTANVAYGFKTLALEITDTNNMTDAFAVGANTIIGSLGAIASAAKTAAQEMADFFKSLDTLVAQKDPENLSWWNPLDQWKLVGTAWGEGIGEFQVGKTNEQMDEEIRQQTEKNAKQYLKINPKRKTSTSWVDKLTKTISDSQINLSGGTYKIGDLYSASQKKWDETGFWEKMKWRNSGKGNSGSGEADFNKNTGAPKMKFSDSGKGSGKDRDNKHFMDFDEIIEREREAMVSLQTEAKLATAKMIGDKKWQAETEYEIAISNIEKEYFRKQEIVKGNFEAEAALQKWHDAKSLEAFQEKTNKVKDTELEAFDKRIEQNNLLFELDKATKEEVSRLNRQALDEKIASLQTELATEALTVDREIELQKQLAEAKKKALVLPQNEQEAFYSGVKQQTDTWNTYFQDIQNIGRAAAQGLNDAFSDFFFDAMTGQLKSLGDYFKSFLQSIARAISQMMANAFAQKIIGSLFSGFGLPGRAAGGPVNYGQPYMVGERGPELFVPQSAGSIVPNHAVSASGGNNVVVNVINQSGQPVQARQEAKFDAGRYVVNVVLEAVANNTGGLRDILQAGRA